MLWRNPLFIVMKTPLARSLQSKNAEGFFFCFGFENPQHPVGGGGASRCLCITRTGNFFTIVYR